MNGNQGTCRLVRATAEGVANIAITVYSKGSREGCKIANSDHCFNMASVLFQYSILFKQEQGKELAVQANSLVKNALALVLLRFCMPTRHAVPRCTHLVEAVRNKYN
jgi:hypothetical protein